MTGKKEGRHRKILEAPKGVFIKYKSSWELLFTEAARYLPLTILQFGIQETSPAVSNSSFSNYLWLKKILSELYSHVLNFIFSYKTISQCSDIVTELFH